MQRVVRLRAVAAITPSTGTTDGFDELIDLRLEETHRRLANLEFRDFRVQILCINDTDPVLAIRRDIQRLEVLSKLLVDLRDAAADRRLKRDDSMSDTDGKEGLTDVHGHSEIWILDVFDSPEQFLREIIDADLDAPVRFHRKPAMTL